MVADAVFLGAEPNFIDKDAHTRTRLFAEPDRPASNLLHGLGLISVARLRVVGGGPASASQGGLGCVSHTEGRLGCVSAARAGIFRLVHGREVSMEDVGR